MREAGLLAPQRARGRRRPRPHDGTIIPEGPNLIWGTDATMAHTARDGWVWAFVAVDHFTAEGWASVARRGDRFAACEPIYDAVRDRFGQIGPDVARGISCRHDWGPQYTSSHFTGSLRWLGICDSPAYVGEPPCNGCAERFIRTLKEQVIWTRRWLWPGGWVLRDERLRADAELPAALGHVAADRGLGGGAPELVSEPLPDPPRRVTLLARGPPVGEQDPVDEGPGLIGQHGPCPHRASSRRRDRRGDRLAHRPAMDAVLAGERPLRHPAVVIAADKLEQLHPAHPSCPPPGLLSTEGWAVGAWGGAISDHHFTA
jgi:hypothetical protein